MTDPDEKIKRRYRELASEEPSAVLDAAILAASRRAVARPSAARRWGGPVSIAAVLMLAVGVALNMQHEQPGDEYTEPASRSVPPVAAPPEAPVPVPAPAPATQTPSPKAKLTSPAPLVRADRAPPPEKRRAEKFEPAPVPAQKEAAPRAQPPAEEGAPAILKKDSALDDSAAQRPAPRPFAAEEPSRPAPQAAPLQAPAAAPLRARREAAAEGESALRAQSAREDPAQELERIARLRAEGRHADADKALEEFRRRHPDFRIPEAMWQRVRPR